MKFYDAFISLLRVPPHRTYSDIDYETRNLKTLRTQLKEVLKRDIRRFNAIELFSFLYDQPISTFNVSIGVDIWFYACPIGDLMIELLNGSWHSVSSKVKSLWLIRGVTSFELQKDKFHFELFTNGIIEGFTACFFDEANTVQFIIFETTTTIDMENCMLYNLVPRGTNKNILARTPVRSVSGSTNCRFLTLLYTLASVQNVGGPEILSLELQSTNELKYVVKFIDQCLSNIPNEALKEIIKMLIPECYET